MSQPKLFDAQKSTKIVAIALAIISLLSLFAMLHHPSVSATDVQAAIDEINREAGINATVHGVLIALIILSSLCLSVYAQHRDTRKISVLFGLVSFWLGTVAMIHAALINGFVHPQLAQSFAQATPDQLAQFSALSTLTWKFNQVYAEFAAQCWCAAMCCWAIDMLSRETRIRIFGVVSLVTSTVMAVSLLMQWLVLTVSGATLFLTAIMLWQIGIAWLLYTQR